MIEYQKQDPKIEPRFACSLCESKMTLAAVMIHLTGVKHRNKYMVCIHMPTACKLECVTNRIFIRSDCLGSQEALRQR